MSPRRPRGAALLSALLTVALVATLAARLVQQQAQALQVETAERARAQGAWVLLGAADYARLILREDARGSAFDAPGEPWSTPLAEVNLASFLAPGGSPQDDALRAFLSGAIRDLQARYNLANLGTAGPGTLARETQTLARLCAAAGLPASTASRLAEAAQSAWGGQPGASGPGRAPPRSDAPLKPQRPSQLAWLGLSPSEAARLAPWVTVLPEPTPINLNTAPREVIAAVLGLDKVSVDPLLADGAPLRRIEDARARLPPRVELDTQRVDVQSRWFEVTGRLRVENRILEERATLERRGLEVRLAWRERAARPLAGDPQAP